MDEKFRKEIVSCVEICMLAEKISKMKVDLTGTNKKGEGYIADLIFATVTGADKDNKYKEVHLAIKIGKRCKELRKNMPVLVECYKRESLFYDTVLPGFRQFQLERNIVNMFDAYPKCYGTFLSDDIEALVLEDLKIKGFALHDKQLTMNLQHIHLILENYAKFHALSYAYRDQHNDEFDKLTARYCSVLENMFPETLKGQSDYRVQTVLRETGQDDLYAKYVEETKNNELASTLAVLSNVPQESVITHGDCHNNNFLFEYKIWKFWSSTGADKDNKYKEVHLAIKIGKRCKELRKNMPVLVECYKRESLFYDTVLPGFRQFQLERNIVNMFDAYPKCYGTFLSDDIEALVLEDLKIKGFALHDKQLTMNLQHIHLILENYAKFHALSYAYRDQHNDEFDKLTARYCSVLENMFPETLKGQSDYRVQTVLRETGRDDLYAKYVEETKNNELASTLAVLSNVQQESVITHGDCHNNNFLFEYKGNDDENPLRVAIIDWQLSEIHSPVLDLSYFLYCAASKEELSHIDELLKFYHSHLTDFMKDLGSDAQKVFPYSTLVEHWRRYSIYGLIVGKNFLHMLYIPEEHAPVFTGNKESDDQAWRAVKLQNEDLYKERLISMFDHYFNFILT